MRAALREEPDQATRPAPAPGARDATGPTSVSRALALQRAAGNRAATALLQRKKGKKAPPKPPDPIDALIKAGTWDEAADAFCGLEDAERTARVKKLKPKQREKLMEGARDIDRLLWADPIIQTLEAVDPKSATIGSLRWSRKTGVTVRAGDWFKALGTKDARTVAGELAFSHAQLLEIIGTDDELKKTFRDPWAYTSRSERMLYVMNLLVDTHGFTVNGAAGIVGNLSGESGLIPSRVEGSGTTSPTTTAGFDDKSKEWTDEEIRDRDKSKKQGPKLPGVGIAQWTDKARRKGFFDRQDTAILYDLDDQVAYLVDELGGSGFSRLDTKLRDDKTTTQQASDAFLEQFERPKDPEASRAARRNAAATAAKLYSDAHAAQTN
jgi:hypothetical protein